MCNRKSWRRGLSGTRPRVTLELAAVAFRAPDRTTTAMDGKKLAEFRRLVDFLIGYAIVPSSRCCSCVQVTLLRDATGVRSVLFGS